MDSKKRSPLKAKPLRYPGQSLDEEIEQIYDENATPYLYVSALAIILMALEWFWFAIDTRPNPLVITVIALVVVAFSVYRVAKLRKQIKSLKLGRDGERAVGQYLEILRDPGYRIFHDIVGNGFNIDHVQYQIDDERLPGNHNAVQVEFCRNVLGIKQ